MLAFARARAGDELGLARSCRVITISDVPMINRGASRKFAPGRVTFSSVGPPSSRAPSRAHVSGRVPCRRIVSLPGRVSVGLAAIRATVHSTSEDGTAPSVQPAAASACDGATPSPAVPPPTDDKAPPAVDRVGAHAAALIGEGRKTFRYGTFGDEDFRGGTRCPPTWSRR